MNADLRLAALGAISLAGYGLVAFGPIGGGGGDDLARFLILFGALFAVYLLAASLALRPEVRGRTAIRVLFWAVLFRLLLLPAGLPPDDWTEALAADLGGRETAYRGFLLYDNDVWRYQWDGHVFGSGLDPYLYSPAELERMAEAGEPDATGLFQQELWQDVFDRLSYIDYRTVYPPLAQWLFRLVHALAPGSVFVWKLLVALLDLGSCLLLLATLRELGGRPGAVLLYAWNPLVLKELAGSGHLDGVLIFFLLLSVYLLVRGLRRPAQAVWGLAAYGLAILTKLTPALLLGLYLRRVRRRWWWVLPAVLAAGYGPFLGSLEAQARAFLAFSREWVFNPGPWLLIRRTVEAASGADGRHAASAVSVLVAVALVFRAVRRDDGSAARLVSGGFLVLGGSLLFAAAVMPWYLLWVVPLAALRAGSASPGERRPEVYAWLALTATSLLSYLIYVDQVEHSWWLWLEYSVPAVVLAWGLWRPGIGRRAVRRLRRS